MVVRAGKGRLSEMRPLVRESARGLARGARTAACMRNRALGRALGAVSGECQFTSPAFCLFGVKITTHRPELPPGGGTGVFWSPPNTIPLREPY